MASSAGNRRTYDRSRLRGSVELAWTDSDGKLCTAIANCINISPTGLCVEMPCGIPIGTQLEVRAQSMRLPGPLTVRNCRRCGAWFRVGLRFSKLLIDSESFGKANKILLGAQAR
jgi:hypothetical protein